MKNRILALTGIVFALTIGAAQAGVGTAQERAITRALNTQQSQAHRANAETTMLSAIAVVPGEVANASVYNTEGKPVGAVQKVELQGAAATRVYIALLGSETMVMVPASQLTYTPEENRLTIQSDAGALSRMAMAR